MFTFTVLYNRCKHMYFSSFTFFNNRFCYLSNGLVRNFLSTIRTMWNSYSCIQ